MRARAKITQHWKNFRNEILKKLSSEEIKQKCGNLYACKDAKQNSYFEWPNR